MSAPWDPDTTHLQCAVCRDIRPADHCADCPACDEPICLDCRETGRHPLAQCCPHDESDERGHCLTCLTEVLTTPTPTSVRAEGPPHESHPSGPIHERQPSEGPPADPAATALPLPDHIQWPLNQAMAWVQPEFRPSLVALVRCAYTQGRTDGLTACAGLIDAHTETVTKL